MYVVEKHISVVEHICYIIHTCCTTKYVVENNMLLNTIHC